MAKPNKEMNKLAKLLYQNGIPFEFRAIDTTYFDSNNRMKSEISVQICSPSVENWRIDAISHNSSYGGQDGLIEIYSEALKERMEYDCDVGFLTAEEAVKYFIDANKTK